MKQLISPKSAIGLIAILSVICAMPLLVSAQSITNFEYEGYDTTRGYDMFSWDTVASGGTIKMQIRGGGIIGVWTSVQIRTQSRSGGTTTVGITPFQNDPGTVLEYRARVGNSSWSDTIELDFT